MLGMSSGKPCDSSSSQHFFLRYLTELFASFRKYYPDLFNNVCTAALFSCWVTQGFQLILIFGTLEAMYVFNQNASTYICTFIFLYRKRAHLLSSSSKFRFLFKFVTFWRDYAAVFVQLIALSCTISALFYNWLENYNYFKFWSSHF